MAASTEDLELEQSKDAADKESSSTENEEVRMLFFQKLLGKSLDVIMSTGRPSQFKEHFQEIRAQNPTVFESITEQLMNLLRSNIEAEINLMIKQEDLTNFFNTLDQIVAESNTEPSQAWRPSGDPASDCCDHIMPVKCTYRDRMKVMLEKIEQENKSLEDAVLPQRARIEENQKQLSQKVQHLKEAADLCQELNVNALQEQAKVIAKD